MKTLRIAIHNTFVRRVVAVSVATATLAAGAVVSAAAAHAVGVGTEQSAVVSTVPSNATPAVSDGVVYALAKVGNLVIAGGSFTTVQDPGSTANIARNAVFAFDPATGMVSTSFAPQLDGTVQAVSPGPVADTVYLGGYFKTVNGAKAKSVALVSTSTGQLISSFRPPALNGAVFSLASARGHLLLAGSFTLANAATRHGLASLNPTTGQLEDYLAVSLDGHHNWAGSGAKGPVGGRSLAVDPTGTRLVVIGNFKTADSLPRDQIAMIALGDQNAVVDTTWATLKYTAACYANAYDTYVTDVQFSPDGSYFVVTATGGVGTNSDGSHSLCDSASRWSSTATGSNVAPTWIDFTGNDTLWSVALTGTAVYVGGHQRWLNNSFGIDAAGTGAVPRPGVAALDPVSGIPLSWNPGRNPRGAGAYALLTTGDGLYVGSDTDYFGNWRYKRPKLGFFPLAGGSAPASTAVAALPANVYLAGPTGGQSGGAEQLLQRPVSGTRVGTTSATSTPSFTWSTVRAAFVVGDTLFFGRTDNQFYRAPFDGSTVGPVTQVDPYNDPAWATVRTGTGNSVYRGKATTFYGELGSVTGAFYSSGRLYYSLAGQRALYYRWFSPDSGIVGAEEFTAPGTVDLRSAAGLTASAGQLLYANSTDGSLRSMPFVDGVPDQSHETILSSPARDGNDWRARSLFLYGPPSFPNTPPTASATVSCQDLSCTFDGTASADADGRVTAYDWNFGDGSTGTGPTPQHTYAAGGTYQVQLTVTDDLRATGTWTGSVTASSAAPVVAPVGVAGVNGLGSSPAVTVPSGTAAGDTEVLVVTTAAAGLVTGPPDGAGWQRLATQTTSPLETVVFSRTATAVDAGSTVSMTLAGSTRFDVRLAVYRGVGSVSATTAGFVNTASLPAPAVDVTAAGSWVVSYWAVRSSSVTSWQPPVGLTVRDAGVGDKSAHVDSLLADTGAVVPVGPHGSDTAVADSPAYKAAAVTMVLTPAS